MPQPIKKKITPKKTTTKAKPRKRSDRPHPKYGTSKLEDRFAKDFLEKMGVKYERQYEAKDIGRFYDFFIPAARLLIEVDGDFYHGYGLLHEQKNPMQKHNEWVDKVKDEWAAQHGIPLIRIWEHDINDKPGEVMKMLKKRIGDATKEQDRKNERRKRH
jgi:very-short-patch-repair endonuclease